MENTVAFWRQYQRFQEQEGWCGVADVQMTILAGAGIDISQTDIARDIYIPWWGTPQQLMLAYLSRYFEKVNYKHGATIRDISFHLDKGHICIVNFWDDFLDGEEGDGHYSIVAECKKGSITLVDSSRERNGIWSVPTKVFNPHWYDTIETQDKLYVDGWLLWVNPESRINHENMA
jgi:hypothetical protein